jgi:DNA-binding SARP family transcriptional activator
MFSVRAGGTVVSEASTRSRKVWMVFKYLITNRHRFTPVETLIDILWEDDGPADPLKSLYTLVSRLRKLLGHAGGVDYILFRAGGYQWNPDAPVCFDAAAFEALVVQARDALDEDERIAMLKEAVELYAGDYLAESASELWVHPVLNYYKRLYMRAVNDLADLYDHRANQDEIINLCNSALEKEPYDENLYERLIAALLINDEVAQAKRQYRLIADRIQKEFGAKPGPALQALYDEITAETGGARDIGAIKFILDRHDARRGALFCTWDTFSKIYQIDKRSDERVKFPVFMALVSLTQKGSAATDGGNVKPAIRVLRSCFLRTLRQGDVVAQYSRNQYLLLLSAYLPENAEAAMLRVKRIFAKEYEGEPVDLTISLSQVGRDAVAM